MKIFYFMGRNRSTKSGVSWKLWKIQRTGRTVTTFWGAATVENRRVVPQFGSLQSKARQFSDVEAAAVFEEARIRAKLAKGYQRRTRAQR